MLKKVFLQTQFGKPHDWTEKYFWNVRQLESTGWYLKVFTPNPWPSAGNIEIVPMDIHGFDVLVEKYCGVKPGNFMQHGLPHKLVSDYYPAYGSIFRDYIEGFDYWAHTNWDIVYGDLSHFLPDSELARYDVWSDEGSVAVNGIFTLYRNDQRINSLYERVPDWQTSFTVHEPCAFDEIQMTQAMRELVAEGSILFGHPRHFPLHSYDRLVQHQPKPNLYFEGNSLIERFEDHVHAPATKDHYGREIMLFHFSKTKRWPL